MGQKLLGISLVKFPMRKYVATCYLVSSVFCQSVIPFKEKYVNHFVLLAQFLLVSLMEGTFVLSFHWQCCSDVVCKFLTRLFIKEKIRKT